MILLTFDDCKPAEWAGALPLFERLSIRATFYVSKQDTIDPTGWNELARLQDAGHSIQFHGYRHTYATRVTDWAEYVKTEIIAGMEQMYRHGFAPTHFAYPYGHWTEESHRRLLPFFMTLRTLNARTPMPYERIWGAFDYDTGQFDAQVRRPIGPGEVTPVVMHAVDHARIADLAACRGDAFVTVEDIKWPR